MKQTSWGARALRIAALAGAGFAAACATLGSSDTRPADQIVVERAQARWDATLAQDFEKAYSFTAPSYRAVTDFKLFRAQTKGGAALVSAKILSAACEAESCAAKVRIEFHAPLSPQGKSMGVINTHYDERWIKEDGQWWLYLQ